MWYDCDVLYAVLYVRVNCFVVCGCAVLRRCIHVYNSDVFSDANMYLDHMKFCIVCINGRRYVCCSECNVVSNERDEIMILAPNDTAYKWCSCHGGYKLLRKLC